MNYTFQFRPVWARLDQLFEGVWMTAQLSLVTLVLGIGLGILAARLLTGGPPWIRSIARSYVEVIRNTPLLVQLFIVYFGLPSLGVRIGATEAALIGLVINLGAYSCEIIRAGIEAVHKSQVEAGMSLALTPFQVFRHVVLPPALQSVYPALCSQFVLVMLATSVASAISADELTSAANTIQSQSFRSFEVYAVTAGLYLMLAIGFRLLLGALGLILFSRQRHALVSMLRAR